MRPKAPMSMGELREIWKESSPDSTERKLLEEIARLHNVLRLSMDSLKTIEIAWHEHTSSRLAAIQRFRVMLSGEPAVIMQPLHRLSKARHGDVQERSQ